ncbi:hypothetical protein [Streptomyces sp. NPDC093568]|uniref:hypothetical protein n=1 Tax=Streptomyces sp. NPDC093568 TaxID=3366041 RepID=UPI0037F1E847
MNTERPDNDDAGASGRDPEEARAEQDAESAPDSAGADEAAEAREPVAEKAPDAEKDGPEPEQAPEAAGEPERASGAGAESEPASDAGAGSERAPDAAAEPKAASDTAAEPEQAPDTRAAPEQTPDTTAGPKAASDTTAEPEQASDTAAAPEQAPDTTAGPKAASDTTAEPEPASGALPETGARHDAPDDERHDGRHGARHGVRHDGPDDAHGGSRRRSPAIIASVAAAVLLVGGGGAYLATTASGGSGGDTSSGAAGDDTPPPLRLDGYSESGGGTNGIAPGEPNPYGVTYKADGDLPDGPGSAPVYRAGGEVGAAEVARLAEALGVDGKPVAQGQTWKVGANDGSGPSLQVNKQAPGTWTFYRYAAGPDACQSTTVCAKTADPAGDPVSEAVARKAAAPVLKAVGQDDAKLDASQVMGAQRVVNASPVVDGLPTYGWTTGVTVNAQGEVVGGSGQLKAPVKGDTYPVLDAEKTLDLMNAAPGTDHRMGIGGCASPVPLKDRLEAPCGDQASTGAETSPDTAASASAPPREVITVEKAVFGLAAHYVNARQALVPSWLFEVKAQGAQDSFTVTYPAVDPKYLAAPTPPAEPTDQPSPRPTGPKDEPTSSPITENVPVDAYTADGKELTVAFTGGVCSEYEVTASESGDRVTVRVTSTTEPETICIQIAKVFHKTVQLDEPLGDREVVGSDGRQVPLEKPGTRLPDEPQTSGAR